MPLVVVILDRASAGADSPSSAAPASPSSATTPASKAAPPPQDIEDRFRRLETLVSKQADQIRQLSEENRVLADQIRGRSAASSDPSVKPAQADTISAPTQTGAISTPTLPSSVLPRDTDDESASPPPDPVSTVPPESESAVRGRGDTPSAYSALLESGNDAIPTLKPSGPTRPFLTGHYDKGFVLVAPTDKQRTPFALKMNITTQLRYTGFARTVESWTDSSGLVLPVLSRSYFSLNRNWFTFTGYAFSPQLQFNATVFSTSTTNQTVAVGAVSYAFSKKLALSSGYYSEGEAIVPKVHAAAECPTTASA
jgi:hypothetical protein